jgi:hypothetical protein
MSKVTPSRGLTAKGSKGRIVDVEGISEERI